MAAKNQMRPAEVPIESSRDIAKSQIEQCYCYPQFSTLRVDIFDKRY